MQLVRLNLKGTVQMKKFGEILLWDRILTQNINLSNLNNLHPAEPVGRVSETQPQNGENYKINTIVAKRKMYIQIYIYTYTHTYSMN